MARAPPGKIVAIGIASGIITLSEVETDTQDAFTWEGLYWRRHRRSIPDRRALSAMPKRLIRSWTLSAFACWLTLLASADDFNLVRLSLPPSNADSEGLLPLDDPNTDFTESSQSPRPSTSSRYKRGCTSSSGPSWTGAPLASPFVASAHGHPPPLRLDTPMRC
jgi:hypothetical protein